MGQFVELREVETVTIANGDSETPEIRINGTHLVGVQMPTAWDNADITFLGSADGTNFYPIYDEAGNEYSTKVDAQQYIVVPHGDLVGVRYMKIRSGTAATPVTQSADRDLILVLAPGT